jgi:ribose/xylose/arabinose/galactoside ABC-type transport system permease subunit
MKIKQIKFLIIPALVATLGTASVFTALTTSCGKDTNTTTISFDSHPDNLEYGHDMIISAHSANGTPVSLSAAGTGKDTK